jgi:hypothetical protein
MVSPADRPDGERAFRLLGPIRGFAAAQLADPGQALSPAWNGICSGGHAPVVAAST